MIYILIAAWVAGIALLRNKSNLPEQLQLIIKGLRVILLIVPVFVFLFWYDLTVIEPKRKISELFEEAPEKLANDWEVTKKGQIGGKLLVLNNDGKFYEDQGKGEWDLDIDNRILILHYPNQVKKFKVIETTYDRKLNFMTFKAESENGNLLNFKSADFESVKLFREAKQLE